jgi:hypothetical protein
MVLKNHGDVAHARSNAIHKAIADVNLAGGWLFESGNHPQRRALAAATWTDKDNELTRADLQGQIPHGVKTVGEFLVEMLQCDAGHEMWQENFEWLARWLRRSRNGHHTVYRIAILLILATTRSRYK